MAGNEEYDEEMEAERELADSAMWKVIQKNTFTRWTNEHLKHTKLQIVDMEKDFSDGLKLIALIEALSGKKFAKYNKRPSFRTQKFENVTMSLKFLEDKEGIKLVNIDSSDIVDQKLKLIMGLIWTLILHYSITMPAWEDEGGFGKDQTPKQRLLAWIQNKIPEKNITNFTSDWNDGTAIAALVDAVAPGLFPDWANLLPTNKVQNAKDAMDLAEKFLDVPQVIKPDEMCNPKVDELSMMTYLSRFPSAKIKSGAPVQQKPNAQRIRAYGPGIEPQGNVVGAPARFIVETANAGKGDLEVIVLDPKGKQEKVELLPNNDRTQSYNCVYTPSVDGPYTVSIKFAGQPSTKQPYLVNVAPKNKAGDPSKVIAQGPGVEKSGVMVNRKTYFDVITKGAGVGVVDVGVFDPQGKPLKATVTKKSDDMWYVEYTAEVPGLHSVNVNFAGLQIPKSPYPVGVGTEGGPPVDASRLPGKPKVCNPRDAAANSLATPLKAAPGSTAPVAEQPQQQLKPVPGKAPGPGEVPEDQAPGQGPSTAAKPGIPASQIPIDAKKCWASGRGIQPKGVRLGDLADFKIHTENAGNAEPRAMVMGPGGTPVQTNLKKLDDVTYECVYKPTKPGLHIVNVTFAGQQIPKSPFKVDVGPLKTSKVVAFGPGLESGVVNQPAKFTVQPNGEGPIGFKIEGPSQAKIDVTKNPQQTEMYVSYLPTAPGEYAIRILSNNDDIPKSPYIADIRPVGEAPASFKPAPGQAAAPGVDPSKVSAFGPGLEKEGNAVNKWAEFTVDATKAGQAPLAATVTDAENKNVELTVVDNKNLTFSCKYLPVKAIKHTVKIVYGGKEVPKSPFLVNVKDSGVGAGKVKVYGPAIEKPVQAKILSYFIIDCKEAGPGEPQVTLTNDKGQPLNFQKKDLKDRTYRVEFTAIVSGVYTSHVTFNNQPAPKSPYAINVLGGPDASKVKVYGPALEAPVNVNELSYFIVDCKEAGPGEPRVVLIGEKGGSVATKIIDQTDRTYKVEFTAPVAGLYNANVQFASSPVPKSPFRITAQTAVDIRQVFVKDLPEFVPVNKEVAFEVVTAGAGPGKVKVVITSPTGKPVPVRLDEKPGVGTTVKFIPVEPGPHKVEVFFSELPVANSPFQVTAEVANPFKVKVYGPAIEKPVFVNEITYFVVDYKEGGPGEPQVKIVDEKGTPVPFNVLDQKDQTHRIELTPITPGALTATVTFAGQAVPKSPFRITVQTKSDTSKVKVYGPALEKPVPIRCSTYFVIDCKEAGPGIPDFNLSTEDGFPVESKFNDNKDGIFTVEFTPQLFSPIIAYVNFLGQAAPQSPYKIIIYVDVSKVRVYGPAVEGPVAQKIPTHFTVDCKEVGPGVPKVTLADGNGVGVPFTLNDNKDGTFQLDFIPEITSPITANVYFADQPVPKSPFKISVLGAETNPSKVKISGPAFEGPVAPKEPTYFNVDCKEAGPGKPKISIIDDNKAPVPFAIKNNNDGTYTTELTPVSSVPLTAEVTFANHPVPQSPFKIIISPASKVKVYGPAVEQPLTPKLKTHFTIDCKEAGPGQPTVLLVDENGTPKQFQQIDNKDGTFNVEFVPETVSPLLAQVSFANEPVPKSPFLINVVGGPVNPSAVKVYGPAVEEPVFENVPTYFVVDCKEAGPGEPVVELKSEDGTPIKFTVLDKKDHTYNVDFIPIGLKPVFAQVLFANQPVPKSPFKIDVRPGTIDASKVKLSGPAVEGPVKSNLPTFFNIDAKEAGPAKPEITLTTEDNKPVKLNVLDKKDGTYKVDFVPRDVKPILAQVKLSNQDVPKSPFKIVVEQGPAVEPSKVNIYGPATEGPVKSSQPTHFFVDAKDAGPGEPEVTLATEDGTPVKPVITDNKDGTYKVDFVPVVVQPIMAQVIFADEQVPKSPFKIPVEPGTIDASKVKMNGPAVEGPVKAEEPTYFVVDAKEAGPGKPDVKLTADNGVTVPSKVKDNNDGTYVVEFVPESTLPIKSEVNFVGQPVPMSPFKISVQPKSGRKPDASKVKLFGPAVEKPVKCCEPTYFVVDTKEAGPGHPEITLTYENGTPLKPVISDNQDDKYKVDFVPTLVQPITARVLFADQHVPKSPLKIVVEPTSHCDTSKVHLYGPATEGPVKANLTTYFVIDAKEAGPGHPEVVLTTEDGSVVKPKLADNHDGTYKVDFVPVGVKPITAQVKYAGNQVPKSPFKIPVEHGVTDASKVKLAGPAVEGPVKSQEPTYFVVDAKEAGPGHPVITLTTDDGVFVPAKIIDNNDATFVVTFTPETVVPITADVKFDNQEVPRSPFKVSVEQGKGTPSEPSKVKLYGPAVEGPVKANEPTYFVVDAKEAGPGHPEVSLFPENAAPLKPVVTDNKDGTFKASFVPIAPKPIVGQVKFAEKQVPKSPFKIQVEPSSPTDASKVKIFGPAAEGPVKSNETTYFVVDAKEAGPGFPEIALTVDDGSHLKPKITDDKNGTYKVEFLPVSVKPITAQVKYAGTQVPKSPFKIPVESGVTDASKVKLSGPAVEGPVKAQEPTYFVVDTKEAGSDKPEVKLMAANGVPVPAKIKDNHDGTYIADFVPQAVVPITAEVKFAGQQVPKSPVQIQVEPTTGKRPDASKVKVYGPAVEGPVKSNRPTYFVVDAKESGPGLPEVSLLPESGSPLKPTVTDNKDGTFKVDFVPVYVQPITAHVKFAEQEIPKSPFKIPVEPLTESEASKVKLYGPAFEGPVKSNQPTYFVVDAKEAGPGYPEVNISVDDGSLVTPSITDNKDGTYTVEFVPAAVRPLTVQVKYSGKSVPKSPFKVTVVAGGVSSSKVKLSGPAVEGPVKSQEPTYFVIDAKEAGPDQPEVKLTPLNGASLPVHLIDNHDGTYVADFVPEAVVPITADVKYAGQQVPKTPLQITVEPSSGRKPDTSKVKLYGPAVEGTVKSNNPTYFMVDVKEAGPGGHPVVELIAEGGTPLKPTISDNKDGTFKVDFIPLVPKPILGQVKYAGQQVPKSPFKIPVDLIPGVEASKVKLSGPAVEGPIKANQPTYFLVDAKEAGPGYPEVTLITDDGVPVKAAISEVANGVYRADFVPNVVRPITGEVKYAGQQVPKSPFRIPVEPGTGPDINKVKVYGPAIEHPVKSQEPTYFVIDTKELGPVEEPNVSMMKPDGSSLPLQKTNNRDGTYRVDFTPSDAGALLSHVNVAGLPVNGSPFKTTVQPKSQNPAKVSNIPRVLTVGKPEPINIQVEGAKRGPATVDLVTPRGNVVSSPVYDKPDGYLGQVTAIEPGPHKIVVKVANEPVGGSPFDVEAVPASLTFTPSDVIDASKVKVYGPGLVGGTNNQPCDFTIDTSAAGPGNLGLTIDGPTEAKIECFDKGNGVFDVRYLPNEPGEYTINVTFDEKPVPHSPFKAQINPEILVDVSGVRTFGPGVQPQGVYLDSVTEFTIDTATVQPKGVGNVKVILTNPSGTLTEAIVNKNVDDTYTCLYTPFEEGPTKIDVTYDGLKVPGSPFVTNVTPGCDPSKVKVYGQGIERGEPNKPQKFVINTRGAGVGGVGLSVVGPTEPQVDCTDNQDGTLSVEYLPETPGDYEIGVTFADQPVPGSPFIVPIGEAVKPFYPDRVKCFGPGLNPQGVKQGQKAIFSVVTNQAGEAPLDVIVTDLNTGSRLPVKVNKNPSGTYDVEYEPHNEGPIRIDVHYGKIPVPGSPFNTVSKPFNDLTKVTVAGEGVKPQVPASIPITFNVDTRAAAPGPVPVDVDIKTPQGKVIKPVVTSVAPGVSQVNYTPEDAGPYQIHVKVANQEIPNSPLRVTAVPTGNPEKVLLPDFVPSTVAPNQTFTFKVQKPTATGPGNVSCKVTKAGQPGFPATEIPCSVQDNHDGTVLVSYPVPEEGVLVVETKFGGVLVPRGRFTQKVGKPGEPALTPLIPTSIATGEVSPQTPQSPITPLSPSAPLRPVEVSSIPVGPDINQVSAVIIKPSGESLPVQVVETEKGTIRVNYTPTETGLHHLKVLYAGQPVPGDPFTFFVHAPLPGQVTAFGPGLVSGSVNQPCVFTVVTKNAGKGGLSLAIEGPSKAEIKCKDNKDGSATITYVPTSPGEYKIVVKHAGHPIPGAPFVAKITGEDRSIFTRTVTTTEQSTVTRQSHVTVGSTRHLSIQVTESDLSNLSALIRSPSGVEEPCGLKRQPSGQLGISFTPKESGEHLVIVFRNGQPIPGSPFRVFIQAAEVGDASRVKIYGENLTQGQANEFNSFIINTKEAGVAGLSISVQGPGKVDIKCTENEDGTTKVTYKPTEPGIYHVTIKYGDKPVPGSPFTINVGGVPSGRVKERIVRQQQAATTTSVGTTCELNITMPGININEIEGSVSSPSGLTEKCQIIDLGNNKFRISFSPKESGIHYVSLKHKGLHIPGSPFQFTVGPIVGGGPEKVRAVGPGLVRGEANKPCHFTVITREAGAGSLSLGVEGPSKAIIDFQDRKDGTSDVNYICSEPGEYLVSVKFNGQHIPDSPFKVYISSTGGDINKLHVQNLQQQGLPVNIQTQFLVEFNGAQGKLDAKVVAPSGQESEATVQEIRPGHFSIVFLPKESGVHYVHLLLNGNHIPGSPYPVQVGVINADPSRVRAHGEGLHHGQSGKPCKFIVNTTESGPGALSVGISGPSKVELQTREVEEGYEFTYTPLAPGPYLITIKYAGNTHIPGSPFKAQIEGVGTPAAFNEQSRVIVETVTKTTTSSITTHQGELICDVSKVTASGEGLRQTNVNQDSLFTVDGSQAGYNVLHVGVAGPHIPVEKVFVNHLGDLRYSVRYQVNQPGRYLIYVKWGEQHIPGSPFVVIAK